MFCVSEYQRPKIEQRVFFDEDGNVISYGHRWPEGPPDERYSAITHPERFAPLRVVADALVSHLVTDYDVRVSGGMGLLDAVGERVYALPSAADVDRVARFIPNDEDCSPMVFVYTSYPGLCVYPGLFGAFVYLNCGFDACDETWESAAEELEEDVLAVVRGTYRETVNLNPLRKIGYRSGLGINVGMGRTYGWQFDGPDGSPRASSVSDASDVELRALKAMKKRLRALAEVNPEGSWKAWPVASAAPKCLASRWARLPDRFLVPSRQLGAFRSRLLGGRP